MQYVYLPTNNGLLDEFTGQWNHHGIGASSRQSPFAQWCSAMLTTMDESNLINWQTYGIDYDSPIDINIGPLYNDGNNGINHFFNALKILESQT